MKFFAISAFAVSALWGQTPQLEIKGIVVEAGTNQPISGATISLGRMRGTGTNNAVAYSVRGDLTTNAQGQFRLQPDTAGLYTLSASKDGYVQAPTGVGTAAQIDAEHAVAEVRLYLARPGIIRGRLVDNNTGAPVVKQRVDINPFRFSKGHRMWLMGGFPTTDNEGRFGLERLSPGDYLISLPFPETKIQPFHEGDLDQVDEGYERVYFPNGNDMDSGIPFHLASGATLDVGTLKSRRVPYYRVRVIIDSANCTEGEMVRLDERRGPKGTIDYGAIGSVACGSDLLLTGYQPGSYSLQASARSMTAISVFEIVNRNLEVRLTLGLGPDLQGRVTTSEEIQNVSAAGLRIQAASLTGRQMDPVEKRPDVTGRFRLEHLQPDRIRLTVKDLPTGYYVKEIRYAGRAAEAGIFSWTGNGNVDVILDNGPSTVTGSVRDGDRGVESDVVLVKYPYYAGDIFESVTHSSANADGTFVVPQLAPGEYRLIAVPVGLKNKIEEPFVLERLILTAERLTLTPRASQFVTLRPIDPTR